MPTRSASERARGAGSFNRRITFQALTDANTPGASKDDFGETSVPPADSIECWAGYETLGGREFPSWQKRASEATARFRIRYRPDINLATVAATHRIRYIEDHDTGLTRTYDIKSARITDTRREIEIEVSEVQ